jgi:hypothetical protein
MGLFERKIRNRESSRKNPSFREDSEVRTYLHSSGVCIWQKYLSNLRLQNPGLESTFARSLCLVFKRTVPLTDIKMGLVEGFMDKSHGRKRTQS